MRAEINFTEVKVLMEQLPKPASLVLAKGGDFVTINVSFAEPRVASHIFGEQVVGQVVSLDEKADEEPHQTGLAQLSPDRIQRP